MIERVLRVLRRLSADQSIDKDKMVAELELALVQIQFKLERHRQQNAARQAKWRKRKVQTVTVTRNVTTPVTVTRNVTTSQKPNENGHNPPKKVTVTPQLEMGTILYLSKKERKKEPPKSNDRVTVTPAHDSDPQFQAFWSAYPRKERKLGAYKSYLKVLKQKLATPEQIIVGARRYAERTRGSQFVMAPTRWLNEGCWADQGRQIQEGIL